MMLSRTLARGHELSLRRAIGAGRGRLLRQLLTEGAAADRDRRGPGGAARDLGQPGAGPVALDDATASSPWTARRRPWTIGAAGGLALGIALVMTGCSAMCALRAEAGDALRAAPRTAGASAAERRLGALLVSVQVALSLTLVVGASVFALNLRRLLTRGDWPRSHAPDRRPGRCALCRAHRGEAAAVLRQRARQAGGAAWHRVGELFAEAACEQQRRLVVGGRRRRRPAGRRPWQTDVPQCGLGRLLHDHGQCDCWPDVRSTAATLTARSRS